MASSLLLSHRGHVWTCRLPELVHNRHLKARCAPFLKGASLRKGGSPLPSSIGRTTVRAIAVPLPDSRRDSAKQDKATLQQRTGLGHSPFFPPRPDMKPMDGNEAAATVAYALSDVSFVYPITPATPMGEFVDAWAAANRQNAFGNVVQVTEMESETGAAGALHGALAAGALATTFTSSQGLLLMIPNLYKIAGELMPAVIHVAARAIASQALSIFGDHQDVMAVRQTGWALLGSNTVQECMDMAAVAHLATLKASVPFIHFFDGFRTSHEVSKISMLDMEQLKCLVDMTAIERHADRALNPNHPHQRGTSQGPDIYMQMLEAANKYHQATPAIVEDTMNQLYSITGRKYGLFEYVGHPEAELVLIMMGSGCEVAKEAVDYLVSKDEKVGLLKVRLFRPWSAKHFLGALPKSAKRIAVLDRTKEPGSNGEPLYLDVCGTLMEAGLSLMVVGGRYGLGSKEFTPAMAMATLENLKEAEPKRHFTVGIVDDVTFSSLKAGPEIDTVPEGTTECLFWGMGSDGTVGANKEAIKIIADETDLYTQAYFAYDAHKSGGVTISHLRFGPQPIYSSYLINKADYLAVHNQSYIHKYNFLSKLRPGGVLVLNTTWAPEELESHMPARVKRTLAELNPQLYIINARAVCDKIGLGKHINMVMQTVFFQLSGVLPIDRAVALLKKSIEKAYSRKGDDVVRKNQQAVDEAMTHIHKVEIPTSWASAPINILKEPVQADFSKKTPQYILDVIQPILALEGDKLPVSVFIPGGIVPPGSTKYEKRAIASEVPIWKADACTQCNMCAFICPHAAIRPALAAQDELAGAPANFATVKAKGGAKLASLNYRIQVSPYDCTGCDLCAHTCPDNALQMTSITSVLDTEEANWQFVSDLPNRGSLFARDNLRGSQFQPPLLEFSGACEGCGETPYVKLLTQMFGERMMVANATGCSSIWGGSAPSNPYTVTADGRGPAWANSLFEDNAQFGFGIGMATIQRRRGMARNVDLALKDATVPFSPELRAALEQWLLVRDNAPACTPVSLTLEDLLTAERSNHTAIDALWHRRDLLAKPSIWIIGGDGWAYDIGYGGLDHVFSTGENVNVLVLDTEMYSNTGGQMSKSTPIGAVTKFAAGGKQRQKKDLGAMAMQYGDVYVASTCLQANPGQTVKAMKEAENYPGVSLIIGYAPCQLHGMKEGMSCSVDEGKLAVETGYWPLYRFDPRIPETADSHPLQLDSRRLKGEVESFVGRENRFSLLTRKSPEVAKELQAKLADRSHQQHDHLEDLSKFGWHHHPEASFKNPRAEDAGHV